MSKLNGFGETHRERKFCVELKFNNWFIRQRTFIEIWSTWEVWRARKMRKSCSRRFSYVKTLKYFVTFLWLMVYKLLSCSPNILSALIRRLADRKCALIAIKQRKRYLPTDLSNLGHLQGKKNVTWHFNFFSYEKTVEIISYFSLAYGLQTTVVFSQHTKCINKPINR